MVPHANKYGSGVFDPKYILNLSIKKYERLKDIPAKTIHEIADLNTAVVTLIQVQTYSGCIDAPL